MKIIALSPYNNQKVSLQSKIANPVYVQDNDCHMFGNNYLSAMKSISFVNSDYKTEQVFKIPEYGGNGYVYRLINGQQVVVIPKPGPVMISTAAKVGAMDEPPELSGISHFIEHSMFNGSENFKPAEYSDFVAKYGGEANAFTTALSTEYTILSGNNNSKSIEDLIKAEAEFVQYPKFTKKMVEKAKAPVLEEIEEYGDDTEFIMDLQSYKHFLGCDIDYDKLLGSKESVKSFKVGDLQAYYDKHYDPSNLVTIVVGDVNPTEVAKLTSKYFDKPSTQKMSEKFNPKITLPEKSTTTTFISPKLNNPSVLMKMIGPQVNNLKEIFAMELLTTCLDGYNSARLNSIMKDKLGVTLSISMESIISNPASPISIGIVCDFSSKKSLNQGIKIINDVINNLEENPITEKELEIAKRNKHDSLNKKSETAESIASLLSTALFDYQDINYYIQAEKLINEVSVEDIKNVAKKYLINNKITTIIGLPEKQKKDVSFSSSKLLNFTGSKTRELFGKTQEIDLPNNAHIIISNNKNTIRNAAVISYSFKNNQVEKAGLTNLLEEILHYGTKTMSTLEFDKILDENCIDLETEVSNDKISFIVTAKAQEDFLKGVELAQDLMKNLNLTRNNFSKAKKDLAETLCVEKYPASDRIEEYLYPNSAVQNTTRKIKSEYNSVGFEEVKDFYNRLSEAPMMTVSLATNSSKNPELKEKFIDIIKKTPYNLQAFEQEQNLISTKTPKPKIFVESKEEKNQAVISQIYKINSIETINEMVAIKALGSILGESFSSRLFADLREKQGLAYDIASYAIVRPERKYLELSISTNTEEETSNGTVLKPENIQKSLEGFKKHAKNLTEKKVSLVELENAKQSMLAKINFIEDSRLKAEELNKYATSPYGIDFQDKQIQAINELTREDIQKAAKKVFSANPVISIQASPDTIKASESYLKTLGSVSKYEYEE